MKKVTFAILCLILLAAAIASAVPEGKFTVYHNTANGDVRVISVDYEGCVDHLANHPGDTSDPANCGDI